MSDWLCSHCGKPTAKRKRAPRRNIAFYGDHDECRREAHRASARRHGKIKYWERKGMAAPEHDARRDNLPPQLRKRG